jgi:hypothetical protein
MPLDRSKLKERQRFRDPTLGIEEEFVQPMLGGRRSVAIISRPTESVGPIGWVVCHSFGLEQVQLGRLEVGVARQLAAMGSPVIRYNGQGYGDSEGRAHEVDLQSHLTDAVDAVSVLREVTTPRHIGLLGARFGGMVAALAADRLGVDYVAAWEPVINGSQFVEQLLRQPALSAIAARTNSARSIKQMKDEIARDGWTDLGGFPLSKTAFEQVSGVRLMDDLRSFHGSSLLVGITPTGEPRAELTQLQTRFQELGGDCTLTTLQDRGGFGRFRYSDGDENTAKIDTQWDLTKRITAETLRWCAGLVPGLQPSS